MEYGTWQARARQSAAEDRDWERTIRQYRKHQQSFGLFGHVELTGIIYKRKGDQWLFVVKAIVLGERKVAFVNVDYLVEGLAYVLTLVDTNGLRWYDDKPPQKKTP